ncbi:hypothetical protein HYZ70_03220 [Candidatus Curtissbacteria bacterium]|nr:hypothetical protein [Candidatus Curtissbacteria bacterium]
MFRDLKIIIPALAIFLLVLLGVYQLYQRTVVERQASAPTPSARFPSAESPSPTPTSTLAPDSQPATGVTSLPETGGR